MSTLFDKKNCDTGFFISFEGNSNQKKILAWIIGMNLAHRNINSSVITMQKIILFKA